MSKITISCECNDYAALINNHEKLIKSLVLIEMKLDEVEYEENIIVTSENLSEYVSDWCVIAELIQAALHDKDMDTWEFLINWYVSGTKYIFELDDIKPGSEFWKTIKEIVEKGEEIINSYLKKNNIQEVSVKIEATGF